MLVRAIKDNQLGMAMLDLLAAMLLAGLIASGVFEHYIRTLHRLNATISRENLVRTEREWTDGSITLKYCFPEKNDQGILWTICSRKTTLGDNTETIFVID